MDSTKPGLRMWRMFRVIDPKSVISLIADIPEVRRAGLLPLHRSARVIRRRGRDRLCTGRCLLPWTAVAWDGTTAWHAPSRSWPAATWNWFLNRKVTFLGRAPDPHVHQWARFAAGSLVGLTVNAGSYALLTTFVGYFIERRWLALLLGVALGGVVNFAVATRYVYRRESAKQS